MRRRAWLTRTARLAAATAAANLTPANVAGAQTLRTMRVGLAEGDSATPTLYALKAGLFKKYGIDAQLVPMPSGAAGLAALAGGSVDVAGSSLLPFFSARSAGLPLEIVAPLAAYSPESVYAVILVRKDSPFKSGRDLNNKTIASPAIKDLNWIATMAWIDQNGGDSSTVRSIELPGSVIPAALEDGRIDAATVTTPRYTQALHGGKVRVLGKSYEAIGKHFLFSALVARDEYAAKNPDMIVALGRAIRDASAYANTHHAETLEIYAAFARIDPKDIFDAPRGVNAQYVEAKDLLPIIATATRYNIFGKPIDAQSLISVQILRPGT